jgi:glycosyltransferase involved in cell wall biosynthesis
LAARREGVPVVFDMAENYPAMIRAIWDTGAKGPFDFVVRNPSLVTRVEQWVLPRVDHVIAVCEESAERIRRAGVAPEKITIVSNTPEIRVGASTASPTEGEVLRVSYLGLVEAMRGIEVIAEAVGILARQGMRIELTVVGDGPHMPNLRAFIKARELSNVVQLHGRLPHEEALKVAQSAHIGVVPHLKSEMTDTTVPNKLFDYMAAGMPVVVSSARPLARIVSETGCGFVFTSGDAQSCADALAALSVHAAWTKCSAAGIEAISKHYNWSLDADRLKRLFATIA